MNCHDLGQTRILEEATKVVQFVKFIWWLYNRNRLLYTGTIIILQPFRWIRTTWIVLHNYYYRIRKSDIHVIISPQSQVKVQYVHFRLRTIYTLSYLGLFLKKLADDQCSSITKGSIYHINMIMSIHPFTYSGNGLT